MSQQSDVLAYLKKRPITPIIDKYGKEFAFPVDAGAWHKLTEDCTGRTFNVNSILEGSRGDKQAKITEYYFVQLMVANGIPINVKTVDWELWDCEVFGRRIDVKSKRRNTNPRNYEYHVDASQLQHPCHHYIFSDVFYYTKDKDAVPYGFAFAGWLPKKEFMANSMEVRKGDVCEVTGFKEHKDARKINEFFIRPMPELIAGMKNG